MLPFEALCESFLPDWPRLEPPQRQAALADTAAFVKAEIAIAPSHIRFGVGLLTAAFFLGALVVGRGRGFGRRGPAWRRSYLRRWLKLGPQAQALVRLVRSLTLLAYLEHALVLEVLGVEPGRKRQERYREQRRRAIEDGGTW